MNSSEVAPDRHRHLAVVVVAGLVMWLEAGQLLGHWLQMHTGTVNEPIVPAS